MRRDTGRSGIGGNIGRALFLTVAVLPTLPSTALMARASASSATARVGPLQTIFRQDAKACLSQLETSQANDFGPGKETG